MQPIRSLFRKLIPHKLLFLRRIIHNGRFFDHFNQIKQYKKDIKLKPADFPFYLSIIAVVKNEAPYIAEWIEYHLLVGVQKFFIYDNESSDNLKKCLEPYIINNIVEYIYFPGIRQQLNSYNDAIKRYRYKSFWLAFIDIDEFLVPVSTETIAEFLRDFEDVPGIEINQVIYGSGGNHKKTNGLVIERFKDHSNFDFFTNKTVKTIVNSRHIFYMTTVHIAEYFNGLFSVNSDKEKNILPSFHRTALHDKIRINHYCIKSLEEFTAKSDRGRAATPGKLTMDFFLERDRGEIKNDPIMDNFIEKIKVKFH